MNHQWPDTKTKINYAIIDKKGIGKERKRVLKILQENELRIISI